MRSDEMIGSAGERCIVTDLQSGRRYDGFVESVEGGVVVRIDGSGRLVRVACGFDELVDPEDEVR